MKIGYTVLVCLFVFLSTALFAGISAPDFVSTVSVSPGQSGIVRHNLGTDNLLVNVMFRSATNEKWSALNRLYGCWYELTDLNSIELFNKAVSGSEVLEFRVMIWNVGDGKVSAQENNAVVLAPSAVPVKDGLEKIPLVTGYVRSQAKALLDSEGWKYEFLPKKAGKGEVLGVRILAQFPEADEEVVKEETVVKLMLEVRASEKDNIATEEEGPCNISGKVTGMTRFVGAVAIYSISDRKNILQRVNVNGDGNYEFTNVDSGEYRIRLIPKSRNMLKVTPKSRKVSCNGTLVEDVNFFVAGEL